MCDIFVIGAGVSGLATVLQLLRTWQTTPGAQNNAPPNIVMADVRNRVGGRNDSVPLLPAQPTPPFMADLCPMRWYPTLQPKMSSMVNYLTAQGATNLALSNIPVAQLPIVTPTTTIGTVDTALLTTYPPANVSANTALDVGASIALATGDYANVAQYTREVGYGFLSDQVSLASFYAEFALAGQDETRFANGFSAFTQAILSQIQAIYSPYQSSGCGGPYFKIMTGMQVVDVSEWWPACGSPCASVNDQERTTGASSSADALHLGDSTIERHSPLPGEPKPVENSSASASNSGGGSGWLSWLFINPFVSSKTTKQETKRSAQHHHGGNYQPAIYRLHYGPPGSAPCNLGFYDCYQVVLTGTFAEMDGLCLGTYVNPCCDNGGDVYHSGIADGWTVPPNSISNTRSLQHKDITQTQATDVLDGTVTLDVPHLLAHAVTLPTASIADLQNRRTIARTLIAPHAGVKVYLHFAQPWWVPTNFAKFCNDSLLAQVIQYAPNTLLIYVIDNEQAAALLNMFSSQFAGMTSAQSLASYGDRWIPATILSQLVNYIKLQLPTILSSAVIPMPQPTLSQLNSLDQVMFHYTEQALAHPKAFGAGSTALAAQYQTIRSGSKYGLWWFNADLHGDGGGWVERALSVVDTYNAGLFQQWQTNQWATTSSSS